MKLTSTINTESVLTVTFTPEIDGDAAVNGAANFAITEYNKPGNTLTQVQLGQAILAIAKQVGEPGV